MSGSGFAPGRGSSAREWLPGRLAGQGFDALGHTTIVAGGAGIGVALVACWLLSYGIGGANVAAPHWFYVPVLIAAVRFGPIGALVAAVAAGILAGPLMPADVTAGTAQPVADWGARAAFFILIGQVIAFVFARSLSSLHAEVQTLRAERALSRAVEHDELRLAYQPIVDLQHDCLVGVEALLRWDHPEHGPIPPTELIEFAEQSDLIVAVGRWVLDRAARQAHVWRSIHPHAPIYIAVNLSGRHLAVAELPEHVAHILQHHRLAPDALAIEITETSLVADIASSCQRLMALKALGLRLAIDDFGTGYSSLAYVRDLPVDVIKIDRSFIERLPNDDHEAMVASVIMLAHSLGMAALAEGVERADQARMLRQLGCDYAQGHFFGRPSDPDEIDRRLAALPASAPTPDPVTPTSIAQSASIR